MKYRAVVKNGPKGDFVVIQTKSHLLAKWVDWCKCGSLETADKVVKQKSSGIIVKEIHNYDKAGNRIFECWM